jgi:hypothetical protein
MSGKLVKKRIKVDTSNKLKKTSKKKFHRPKLSLNLFTSVPETPEKTTPTKKVHNNTFNNDDNIEEEVEEISVSLNNSDSLQMMKEVKLKIEQ